MTFELNPKDLLSVKRFDVIIKYLYAKSYLNKYKTDYYLNLYKEHLRVWNNFIEYDNKNKRGFESFKTTFEKLIDDINTNGFDVKTSKLPVYNNSILNGSHRLAASLLTNKTISCIPDLPGKSGQEDCGWGFFKSLGYDENYADRVALEYVFLKENTHIITIFPKVTNMGKLKELENIINKNSKVFYNKRIKLTKTGLFNLIRELYLDEQWVGTYPKYDGYLGKTQYCYGDGDVLIYLCEFNSINDCVRTKEEIRKLYGVGKHSVHINDTHEETIRISKALFNKNSVDFLNKNQSIVIDDKLNIKDVKLLNNFENYLKEYRNVLKNINTENYCITSSSVLGVYGLRDVVDLDYLSVGKENIDTKNIHSHNEYGKGLYDMDYYEIIHNPNNHFYSRGFKFVNLDIIKKLKLKRGENKDITDLKLIDDIK